MEDNQIIKIMFYIIRDQVNYNYIVQQKPMKKTFDSFYESRKQLYIKNYIHGTLWDVYINMSVANQSLNKSKENNQDYYYIDNNNYSAWIYKFFKFP